MAKMSMITTRRQRILSIFLVGLVFLVLQVSTGVISTHSPAHLSPTFWVFYACYGLGALLFYSIGSLCWLYAYGKQHIIATLLFGFTTCMMVAFSSLSASTVGNGLFTTLSSASTALAVLLLLCLLLYFPYTLTSTLMTGRYHLLFTMASIVLVVLCAFTVVRDIAVYLLEYNAPSLWTLGCLTYYLLSALAIIVVIVRATRSVTSVREQQQSRFFFLGTLLSFVPILGLTVLPTLLHARLVVDGSLSVIFLVLFPLTMGYAVLRYNLLVFDSYVKRVVTTVVSIVGLALLAFVLFAVGSVFVSDTISLSLASLLLVGVVGAPCIWWGCKLLTERVFFPEAQYYKRMLKQVQQNQAEQSFDLQHVAHLLVIDVMTTLNAPGACVFVLDEEIHANSLLATPLQEAERTERVRSTLLSQIADCLVGSSGQEGKRIAHDSTLVQQLQAAKRPLFWSEIVLPCGQEELPNRVTRYIPFAVQREERSGPLFAPLRSPQGTMIGIVLVSERGDEQRYGGPDLEALVQLVQLSALPIETARQFHIAMLQQERTAREVEEAYQQQRHLTEMKDQLIIHMSHELRTPLSEVSGYLALLTDYGDGLDAEHRMLFLEKATHGCDELLQLLATVLEASQSNVSDAPSQVESVALAPLVEQEVEHLEPSSAQHHSIVVQIDEQFFVKANEQSLRQVVRNLLSNALKYSPEHTTVTVRATTELGRDRLSVEDKGSGISSEEMPLLFQKFVRLPRHHSGSIRGSGLGLHISKQFVEAMGGQIWAESSGREGEGTTFFVQFASSEGVLGARAA